MARYRIRLSVIHVQLLLIKLAYMQAYMYNCIIILLTYRFVSCIRFAITIRFIFHHMHVLYEACDMIPEFHVPLAPCTWLHPKTILLLRKKFEN